jgi:hypothetical protein
VAGVEAVGRIEDEELEADLALPDDRAAELSILSGDDRRLVDKLPPREQHVLRRPYFEDANFSKFALELKLSRTMVIHLWNEAVKRLRRLRENGAVIRGGRKTKMEVREELLQLRERFVREHRQWLEWIDARLNRLLTRNFGSSPPKDD